MRQFNSTDGPANLESFQSHACRPVCLSINHQPTNGTFGTNTLAHSCPTQICISLSEPSRTDNVQGQRGRGAGPVGGPLLAHLWLIFRNWFYSRQPLSSTFLWGRIVFVRDGAPYGSRVQIAGDVEVLGDLPKGVVNTITSARAPSMRHVYILKWNPFVEWCSSYREDPRTCSIRAVLSFLPPSLPTMILWTVRWLGSMTWWSGSLGKQGDEILLPYPHGICLWCSRIPHLKPCSQ